MTTEITKQEGIPQSCDSQQASIERMKGCSTFFKISIGLLVFSAVFSALARKDPFK